MWLEGATGVVWNCLLYTSLRAPLFGALTCPPSTAYQCILEGVRRLARRGLDNEALAYRHGLALLRRHGMLAPASATPSLAVSSSELSS